MRFLSKSRAALLVSGACIVLTSPATAQEVSSTADGVSAEEQAQVPGDIVVTAQRFASLASKTPVALTAIEGDQLIKQGVANPADLGDQVPNLSIVRNNGLQITIRGVTSNDNTEKGDPSAAFLLDGVYIARPQAQEVSFYDIDRVEVLRGPQGTLYGRNTTAGVINVITNRPQPFVEGAANLTIANFGTLRTDAMVNVPLGDWAAFRIAGAVEKRDSYLIEEPGDTSELDPFKENYSVRGQGLFQLGASAELLLRADYSDLNGRPQTIVRATNFYAPSQPGCLGTPILRTSETNSRPMSFEESATILRRIRSSMARPGASMVS